MSVQQLPSGRWRAVVRDPATGKRVSAAKVLGLRIDTFESEDQAKGARHEAKQRLTALAPGSRTTTVELWHKRWLTDKRFTRGWEPSTLKHHERRTATFVRDFGTHDLDQIDIDLIENIYLRGGQNEWTVPSLCKMFSDAVRVRLIASNPFAGIQIAKTAGNDVKQPPTVEQVNELLCAAREIAPPGFAAWLSVACWTGARPGELDGLRWDDVDFDNGWIHIERQFNKTTRTFTTPKSNKSRKIILTPQARSTLLSLPDDGGYCFQNLGGDHWTSNARSYWWDKIREATGWEGTLYLATRHFAGWYMWNVLEIDGQPLQALDVAEQLGHADDKLVSRLYGHKDRELRLERVRRAYGGSGAVLRGVEAA